MVPLKLWMPHPLYVDLDCVSHYTLETRTSCQLVIRLVTCAPELIRTFSDSENPELPERIPKNSDSGVRSELDRLGCSENPEPPNPEKIDRWLKFNILPFESRPSAFRPVSAGHFKTITNQSFIWLIAWISAQFFRAVMCGAKTSVFEMEVEISQSLPDIPVESLE